MAKEVSTACYNFLPPRHLSAQVRGDGLDSPVSLAYDPHLLYSQLSISMRGNRGVGESYASVVAGVRTVITLEQARGPQGRRACSLFTFAIHHPFRVLHGVAA